MKNDYEKICEEYKTARKWVHQSKLISLVALLLSVIALIIRVVQVLR